MPQWNMHCVCIAVHKWPVSDLCVWGYEVGGLSLVGVVSDLCAWGGVLGDHLVPQAQTRHTVGLSTCVDMSPLTEPFTRSRLLTLLRLSPSTDKSQSPSRPNYEEGLDTEIFRVHCRHLF